MALHRYGDFRVEVFYFDSPCIVVCYVRKSKTTKCVAGTQLLSLHNHSHRVRKIASVGKVMASVF